ncbi:aspartyl-tRNA synthetase [Delitschia confertaspora ATCC 74209]|uniref:Aspartyl-tRNA synthetase n=1 Tax=Delitschia confertaspora ATCC 74209 TaxID=1513339 RepID=A0A9P4MRM1_9PLEO|nr:aspartyl-tRNA synthetase [Delitschia confertaspora ATCC 74209]
MLSSKAAARSVSHNWSLRSSYVEISKFLRTKHHGNKTSYPKFVGAGRRYFAVSARRTGVEVDSSMRKVLDTYKETLQPPTKHDKVERLGPEKIGQRVDLYGYLGTRRDVSKKMSFALLRSEDLQTCVQLVSMAKDAEGKEKVSHVTLKGEREWSPVHVNGVIKERKPAKDDTVFGMKLINTVEVELDAIEPLNDFPTDIVIKEDTVFPPELRHLQIRTNTELRDSLRFRSNVVKEARAILSDLRFVEIETPMLFKSTPEGAREFIVPTRNKGLAYALPQSPQQYKQILMASGIPKYFQFARCFRDEDLRADRQPEFTQLDMELAFAGDHDVMHQIEDIIRHLWANCLGINLESSFLRMSYHDAMASYGSDKPDLRLKMKIHDVTSLISSDLVNKISDLENPIIEGIKVSLNTSPRAMRKFIADFLDSTEGKPFLENPDGGPGIFISDPSRPMSGLDALGFEATEKLPEALRPEPGDLLVLQARKNEPFSGGSTTLGNLRLALNRAAVAADLIDPPEGFRFVWIVDFPLFSPTNDTDPGQGGSAGLSSTHHPFTAPKTPADVDMLLEAPEKVIAAHYDIVVNGVELGGGSRRIHNAEVQEFVLRDVLKMSKERLEDFRHLLEVLRSGCPPHAGIALGWDRLIAIMLGKSSVRDVIAFPKSGKGEDLLVKSPNALTKEQLETYHLQLRD